VSPKTATNTGPDVERDEARDFGNEQDMSVHDKFHPALGPTEEAQDVTTLNRVVVPMGAFTDPNNPAAASASVNLSIDKSPVTHAEDYGRSATVEQGLADQPIETTMTVHSPELRELEPPDFTAGQPDPETARGAAAAQAASAKTRMAPEDRDDWTKADWVAQARAHGLAVSGNFDAVKSRVEEYEADQEQRQSERAAKVDAAKSFGAEDWKAQIAEADDLDALDELRSLYQESGASYVTVESAFEQREAEFNQDES